jgi:hypothetical protein
VSTPAPSPLDTEQLIVLAATRALTRKLRLARGLALTNVVGLAVSALFSVVLGALDFEVSLVGLAFGALSWNENRGRLLLIEADARATGYLALNQLLLLGVVLAYCGWNALSVWSGPNPLQALTERSPELEASLRQLGDQTGRGVAELGSFARSATLMGYGLVAALSLMAQGLMAHYYRGLRSTVVELAESPAWARALR